MADGSPISLVLQPCMSCWSRVASTAAEAVAVEPARTNNKRAARGRQQTTQHIRCLPGGRGRSRARLGHVGRGPCKNRSRSRSQAAEPPSLPLQSTHRSTRPDHCSLPIGPFDALSTRPEELSMSLFFTLSERGICSFSMCAGHRADLAKCTLLALVSCVSA